jgi:hypothetical protein
MPTKSPHVRAPLLVASLAGMILLGGCGGTQRSNHPQTATATPPVPTLKVGQSRTFPKGQLAPGQTLVCVGNGKTIRARVPQPKPAVRKHPALTFSTTWIRGISIEIDFTAQGTYFISCS